MEVRIRYKEKNKLQNGSNVGGEGQPSDVEAIKDADQPDKDKLMMRMYHFTEQQYADLKDAFSEFDRMGTGLIPAHDFGNALRSMGQAPTEAELLEMLQEALLDDNGRMSLEEFLRLIGGRGLQTEPQMRHSLENALRFFDKEGRGMLNAEELKATLQSYGEPLDDDDVTELVKMADVKGDGRIDYIEFMRKLTLK